MGRAGGAFDTDWMFAQLAAPDRCEPEAASAAQSMNGRYAQGAVIASRGVNDRKARTPARDAGYGEGRFVAKCLLLRGVFGCG